MTLYKCIYLYAIVYRQSQDTNLKNKQNALTNSRFN
jgi:hypothetical protein